MSLNILLVALVVLVVVASSATASSSLDADDVVVVNDGPVVENVGDDLIQCESWNGTYNLQALFDAYNASGQTTSISAIPSGDGGDTDYIAYSLCRYCLFSQCLRGTFVGLITNSGSQCQSLASNLGVFNPSERGFTLAYPQVSIRFMCNLGAGIGQPVVTNSAAPYSLVWQSKYICPMA
ncbi:uncharacterized protein AMSG_03246 [Thecamonas trahens ATCC 50062]|uniref:Secreted protein n=1 Tax=Thecamonas trahens ATCC 50062 TaxID=461836 RepID=A0A0L0D3L1_THETB|nr:hypothetical protein AMSG_03246 [Thecamonas trahens ATCC 50062]KNC46815.1 hypothetical protein AMSG_03246 [Thecamonas trahens ATCC 50062]|eukprot:XP_013760090.1 hypothetical protein AMSG_03246 [Thecamonas trahens ATCC 50062]